jgi:hypothetical protein
MARAQNRIHRVRLEPVAEETEDTTPQLGGCVELAIGCLSLLAGVGAFITGITGIVMALRHGTTDAGLCLIAAALAFGFLVITLFRA